MERSTTAQERSRWLEQLAIQEAALDLTLEKGYRGFTMDELAQRTGMPRRTLFQRVGDNRARRFEGKVITLVLLGRRRKF